MQGKCRVLLLSCLLILTAALLMGCTAGESEEALQAESNMTNVSERPVWSDLTDTLYAGMEEFEKIREDLIASMGETPYLQSEEYLERQREEAVRHATRPFLSETRMENTVWDEDLLPYAEYDWLGEERVFEELATRYSTVKFTLADLNQDGQRELMITVYADTCRAVDQVTLIYTVKNGQVFCCGETKASAKWVNKYELIGEASFIPANKSWLQNLFDVYLDGEGNYHFLSYGEDLHAYLKNYIIYETTLEDGQISYKPILSRLCIGDRHGYWTEENWGNFQEYIEDDEDHTKFMYVLSNLFADEKKVETDFFYSPYEVPGCVKELSEEEQEIVRYNIKAGLALCTKQESTWQGSLEGENSYFFPKGTDALDFGLRGQYFINPMPEETRLTVELVKSYGSGNLYELKFYEDYSGTGRYSGGTREGWDRFHLGYFYVRGEKIYRIMDIDAEGIMNWSEQELMTKGQLVCQSEPMDDQLDSEEKGFHEVIVIEGNTCRYSSWENYVETGFFETFVWEKGKGLMEYYAGYGAGAEYLELESLEEHIPNAPDFLTF